MNIFFRILLAIYAFCLMVVSVISMIITFQPQLFDTVSSYISKELKTSHSLPLIILITSFVFFLISLMFLLSGVKSGRDKRAVSKHTNIGEIKISLDTIENIALAASRKLSGVRETKAYISRIQDNVSILIKAVVLPDINIPVLSEDMQVKVKKSVEECSGVKVSEVKILIDNLHSGYKSRVE
jgi:uncharacterized alkaline shock family protein YloU